MTTISRKVLFLAFCLAPLLGMGAAQAQTYSATGDPDDRDEAEILESIIGDRLGKLGELAGEQGDMSDLTDQQLIDLLGLGDEQPATPPSGETGSGWGDLIDSILQDQYAQADGGDGFEASGSDPERHAVLVELLKRYGWDGDTSTGGPPPDYDYYDRREFTPMPTSIQGSYEGSVTGRTASNATLSGTATFDVDLDLTGPNSVVDMSGQFDFGADGVIGLSTTPGDARLQFDRDGHGFLGGTVTSTDSTNFDFYGPTGEQYAGTWGFTVTGGTDPGAVTGEMVTSRTP